MTQRTALITGATGGLGQAIAKTLAAVPLRLALMGRSTEKLDRLRRDLGEAGQTATFAACDLGDRAAVQTAVDGFLAALGSIDVLVCSSGLNVPQRSLRSIDPADFDRVIASNLTHSFNIIHRVLPSMRTRGDGLIIQMGSLSSLRSSTLAGAAYSASKFAQLALGVVIGREERGRNIRSTVICAGEVNTPFLNQRAGRPGGGEGGGRRDSILQPADIAAAVKFLVELPPHAHVPELVIKPTIDDFS
ncbi:MAG TPA: SDR family oxidoreductase [Tepidisphaeraceae bacterium]|nr:SDR family oxidoreductase [Tepidisphaeraceae bacterium]